MTAVPTEEAEPFEEALSDLVAIYRKMGTPLDEVISGLELQLYALKEEEGE